MSQLAQVEVGSRAEWRAWLEANHMSKDSIWLVFPRKGAGETWLSYDAIVEEALCFGWVDSLPRALDERRSMLRVSPRKPKSAWSAVNKQRIDRLVEAGLMRPAGQAMVDLAKRTGTWDALNQASQLTIPDDLAVALATTPPADRHFAGFPPSVRRGILEWLQSAKRPETRAKRIAEIATLAAENRRANQWRG